MPADLPLPPDLPIVDHHCHLAPSGEGVAAARRFRAAGGTHLFLATQNYEPRAPRTVDDYRRQFETTEQLAHRIESELGLSVYCVLAPYPIDLVHAAPSIGLAAAASVQEGALDLAVAWIRDRRAVALGEVGRPHFPIEDPALRAESERLFDAALARARDADCPAIVHCEDLTEEGYRSLAERARRQGLRPERVVKHYARARVPPARASEIPRSYLAKREVVIDALADDGPWFWETDFLDDPRRPGAVLDLETVPRRARWIVSHRPESVERLRIPFEESIRQTYGWVPTVPSGGPRP